MNFKELVAKDIQIFINTSEFASSADIDGSQINVVIDNDKLKDHQLKMGGEGLVQDGLLFHVKKSDMPFVPRPQQNITFNDSDYQIVDVQEDEGMYTITLKGYES